MAITKGDDVDDDAWVRRFFLLEKPKIIYLNFNLNNKIKTLTKSHPTNTVCRRKNRENEESTYKNQIIFFFASDVCRDRHNVLERRKHPVHLYSRSILIENG